ncbi:hypothetical protein GCK72_018615 [Caenorhabditis remanei]|nr:hypothetical protein GCK72_018615 [Caenorhabditis remanei]KAF1752061.1 hypothetical protein GCK72_018615 [Caenorhabditis remanei]
MPPGRMCLSERINYRKVWPCEHDKTAKEILEEREDREAFLKGAPSAFARTGFYDRLFRQQNLPTVYDDNIPYYPNYGYNPNKPVWGLYRYSNYFINP